jgi:hypothetical protein
MHYSRHAVVNTVLGTLALRLVEWPIISRTLLPVILAGLIDADHFLYHVWKQRTLSFRKIKPLLLEDWDKRRQRFYPFHTFEFGLVFTILVYYTPMTWPWAFGYWVHLSSDAYHNWRLNGNISSWIPKWIGTLHGLKALKAKRRFSKIERPYARTSRG